LAGRLGGDTEDGTPIGGLKEGDAPAENLYSSCVSIYKGLF